jgi:hypothetical protein
MSAFDSDSLRVGPADAGEWIERCVERLLELDPSIWPEHAESAATRWASQPSLRNASPDAVAARLYRAL